MDPDYERETGRMRAEMERIEGWLAKRANLAALKLKVQEIRNAAPDDGAVAAAIVLIPIFIIFGLFVFWP